MPSDSSLTIVGVVGLAVICFDPDVHPAAKPKFTLESGTSRQMMRYIGWAGL